MELVRIDDNPAEPDEVMEGCGWEWDHTVPVGENVCTECDTEVSDQGDEEE
ncbi:hypothetical protein [Acrocarpospora sp. B8E8]|uniref:hypothetical protein n=1 Tax=Acrocarpospora sp. B8E8 TaxID=3153572 RepID=UPI00325C848E